jgi:siroheme synthase-like protein
VVLGAGKVGLRKARSLLSAGFGVVLVDRARPRSVPRRAAFRRAVLRSGNIAGAVRGASLVVSALGDRPLEARVSRYCRRSRIPVNVVDVPDLCTFTMPAVAARGYLVVAVSTSGLAPFLSAALRKELEPLVARRAPLVSLVAALRRRYPGRAVLGEVFRDPGFRKAVDRSRWKLARSLAFGIAAASAHSRARRS